MSQLQSQIISHDNNEFIPQLELSQVQSTATTDIVFKDVLSNTFRSINQTLKLTDFNAFILPFSLGLLLAVLTFNLFTNTLQFLTDSIVFIAFLMTLQGAFFVYLMIYAWEDEEKIEGNQTLPTITTDYISITALVPARHEANVIADTMRAIDAIDYPEDKKEVFVLCRADDIATIAAVKQTIYELNKSSIRLHIFDDDPINKPHCLNIGLEIATKEVIAIFDAEDQPHPNIYHSVNAAFAKENADVVQSGVQLMNFRSSWFSLFNVLEYYFWFKSALHFFAKENTVPLGGNSVFFKKKVLKEIGGWDENCLTEDADIGFRLSLTGAKVRIIYNEGNATQEETPSNLKSFIKQRTRWNQGFLQILLKGDWFSLPSLKQKVLASYILILPELQSLLFLLIPISIIAAFTLKLSVLLTMLTLVPMLLLVLQLVILNVGLYEFAKSYQLKYPWWIPLKTIVLFYPYQIVLGISALRAMIRVIFGTTNWEKTKHTNAHREQLEFQSRPLFA